jgi:uncharacterized membrane protein
VDPYLLVKYVHVLLAILAVGYNLSYGVWRSLARGDADRLRFTLSGILTLDRIANAGYGLLLLTGLVMVFMHQIPLTTFWVAGGLVLYVAVAVTGAAIYAPIARRQRALLDTVGPADPAYLAADRRGMALGIVVTVLVLAIVFLMVVNPSP